ncbi:complement C1r-B subcomponent-like isoform X2 [Anabas testudineus]|uniref:complement C1r-B subcomponent-like isoform X2 n=1 Tax=Anabas testudineus TaxID=64144 RepID=UPI000E453F0C|nr:complement C1r-B subcomponent-like isoform X2 [Anabas testudineus]
MHGEVQSPQYPRPYPPNLMRQWDLWVPEGFQIQLTLKHLDIKTSDGCHQDSLTVLYDQKVLGKFCGQGRSSDHPSKKPILSPGNRLTLIFQTSDSTPEQQQHIGFSATHKAIDIDECSKPDPGDGLGPLCSQLCVNTPGSYRCSCHNGYKLHLDQRTCVLSCSGCIFDKREGRLSSPGYPQPSPPFLSCKHIISVEPRFTVILNFTGNFHIDSVDTQEGPSCLHHWLQVTVPGREPMKLCGAKSPGLIATNSNTVRLDYHTDEEGLSNGWSLEYSTHITDCGEPEPLLNGRVTFLSGSQNQYLSVIQYHCNEPFYYLAGELNATFTCQADGKWKSNNNSDVTPTCIPVCGQPTKRISAYQRIIGGSDAPDETIPWQVMVNIEGGRGGGMIIADRWIMTAASVALSHGILASNDTVKVYTGLTDIKRDMSSPVYAASVHVHPQYNNPNYVDYNNDIALIKLRDPITFNSSVMPVCLPAAGASYQTGTMGLVSGFGTTDRRRIWSNKLKYVYVPLVDKKTCANSINFKTRNNRTGLTRNMFCAGLPEGGKDSCLGDGGGPFVLSDSGRYWGAGIVSWGFECGQQGTYGVYTKVTNYLNWIHKTMKEN